MKPVAKTWNLAGQMPLISLIVLCAATALLTNRFLSPFNLTNILVQSSIMAVIAIGMTFVIIGGGFDLSVGSTVALSGCVAAMTMVKFGITAGVLAGIATGAAVRLANGLVIAKLGVNPFITTLGTMVLVRGVVFLVRDRAGDDRGLVSALDLKQLQEIEKANPADARRLVATHAWTAAGSGSSPVKTSATRRRASIAIWAFCSTNV